MTLLRKPRFIIVITAIWNWPFSHVHLLLTTQILQSMKHYIHTIKLLSSLFTRFWHFHISLRKQHYASNLRHVCYLHSEFMNVTTLLPTSWSKRTIVWNLENCHGSSMYLWCRYTVSHDVRGVIDGQWLSGGSWRRISWRCMFTTIET